MAQRACRIHTRQQGDHPEYANTGILEQLQSSPTFGSVNGINSAHEDYQ